MRIPEQRLLALALGIVDQTDQGRRSGRRGWPGSARSSSASGSRDGSGSSQIGRAGVRARSRRVAMAIRLGHHSRTRAAGAARGRLGVGTAAPAGPAWPSAGRRSARSATARAVTAPPRAARTPNRRCGESAGVGPPAVSRRHGEPPERADRAGRRTASSGRARPIRQAERVGAADGLAGLEVGERAERDAVRQVGLESADPACIEALAGDQQVDAERPPDAADRREDVEQSGRAVTSSVNSSTITSSRGIGSRARLWRARRR